MARFDFKFDISHGHIMIPGNVNLRRVAADALSRLHPSTVPAEPQLRPGPSVSAMDRGAHIDTVTRASTWSLSQTFELEGG